MDPRIFVRAAFLGAVTALSASPARSAPAVDPPLRHLVFDVDTRIDARTETVVPVSNNLDPARGALPSSGMEVSTAQTRASGTITVDVVAATADDGLVVDVSEDAPPRRAPKVRVAITSTGILIYDPQANITDEENSLLPFLARQAVPPGDFQLGSSWSRPVQSKNAKLTDTYRIRSVDGTVATIGFEEHVVISGANALDIVMQGQATYDATALVPTTLHFARRLRQEQLGGTTTTDIVVDYSVKVDSLASQNVAR